MSDQIAIEFEALDVKGRTWFEVHSYPSGGGISVFFRDITERKRAADERLTTSKLESLGTLAGGIAHDLNNILTVISGNIGLAQLEAPSHHSGNLLSFLARAGQAAQHAARLSNQLLTFSKGGAPLKKVASVSDLLQQAAEFSLHGSNLRAAIEIEDHLGKAAIDVGQVEQVINALIINTREAMPNGGSVTSAPKISRSMRDADCLWKPGATSRWRSRTMAPALHRNWSTKFLIPISRPKQTSSRPWPRDQLFHHSQNTAVFSTSKASRPPARPLPSISLPLPAR